MIPAMNAASPLVSIVMCTYNGERFLRQQLQSLQEQTYSNIEFICSDNSSNDSTASVLKEWCSKADNRYFFNCTTKGLNANFYSAIQQAHGEYVIFCDQDDIWLPQKVEKLIAFHHQHSDCSMVYCLSKEFHGEVPSDTTIGKRNYLEGTDVRKTMLISFTLGHNMCLKRDLLLQLPSSPDEVIAFDWWITVSAMCMGPIKCLPEVLTYWRKHTTNTTHFLNSDLFYRSRIGYLQRFYNNPLMKPGQKEWIKQMERHLAELEQKEFSYGLLWFYLKNGNTIFFYKTKKNPITKWISYFKWSVRMSKRSHQ